MMYHIYILTVNQMTINHYQPMYLINKRPQMITRKETAQFNRVNHTILGVWLVDAKELYVCEVKNARMVHGASHHCSWPLGALFVCHRTIVR